MGNFFWLWYTVTLVLLMLISLTSVENMMLFGFITASWSYMGYKILDESDKNE